MLLLQLPTPCGILLAAYRKPDWCTRC